MKLHLSLDMSVKNRSNPEEKRQLHARNMHRARYDLRALAQSLPELSLFIVTNKFGDESIAFTNPDAVKALNKALLLHHYNVKGWDIPKDYLCPPIPGRADYIHYLADLLAINGDSSISKSESIRCLDIGTGAGCIYPLIGHKAYGWSFLGSEIDDTAIASANRILENNQDMRPYIELRKQEDKKKIFDGIVNPDEKFDVAMCNPPFHASAEEARKSAMRKTRHLGYEKSKLNFGGQHHELWCDGGEVKFIQRIITESKLYRNNCRWFTTLVSQETHLDDIYRALEIAEPSDVKTISMGQGNKVSRIVGWTFV